ncbi:hypothetical protein JI750_00840 [Flavobacterium sp. GN10]|uniref:Bacteriocin-type signal sequence-containing protein n=1 Tax=Flavobacterium tagetis TaxID=2801336 RepID=A0ABS1K7G7_9FLAO|nr:hypothetical protein [Flavobacterium tagetis]MBL0735416.1 hypothetical protein [Flavobacterium tagetis]
MKKDLKSKLIEKNGILIGGFSFLSPSELIKIKGGIKEKEQNLCNVNQFDCSYNSNTICS